MKRYLWLMLLFVLLTGCCPVHTPNASKKNTVSASATTTVKVKATKVESDEEEMKVELPEDVTTASFKLLMFISVQWEVGSFTKTVHKARAELRRRGLSVLPDVVKSMPFSGGLASRAYCDYFKSLKEDALAPLAKMLESTDQKLVGNAIHIIYTIKLKTAIPALRKLLDSKEQGSYVSRVLAYLGDKEVIPILTTEYFAAPELSKLSILRALMALKEVELATFYITECGNKMVSIRRLAQNALVSLKNEAIPAAIASLKSTNSFRHRNLLEALGRIGETSCIAILIEELHSTNWKYRFSAARALGFCKKNLTKNHLTLIKKAYNVEKDEVCRREITRILTEELPWRTKDLQKTTTP